MKRILPLTLVILLALAGGAWLLFGSDDDSDGDQSAEKTPDGVIRTNLARDIRLNITRAEFEEIVREEPAKTKKVKSKRRETVIADMPEALRREVRRKYPKRRTLVFPAQTYTCLLYHGQQPKLYAWQFCFGEKGTLEFLNTTPPIS